MQHRLDPQAQALLEVMRASGSRHPYELSVADAREAMRAALIAKGDQIDLDTVRDISLPTPHGGLPIRLYRPSPGVLPVALFLHGGGWILNDLDTHDRLCRRIAARSGWMLVALAYRRSPEHKHPAALEDTHLAYRWLLDNATSIGADPSAVALIGESAGATTAACLSLMLRDLGAPRPVYQVLAYPVTGMFDHWESHSEHESGYTLDLESVRWSLRHCVSTGQDLRDPYLLPLAAGTLAGVAPALVMTAEFDPVRDEGIAYAERLEADGVPVKRIHAFDQMHGFLLLDRAIDRAGELIDELADSLSAVTTHQASAG